MNSNQSSLTDFQTTESEDGIEHELDSVLASEINSWRSSHGGQLAFIQDERPPPPEKFCVYTLMCENLNFEEVKQNALQSLGRLPSWARSAADYSNLYYVGKTMRPYRRVVEHGRQRGRASKFTRIFTPIGIRKVTFHSEEVDASEEEMHRAEMLRRDGAFVPPVKYD